jgi:ankyrin repeat protein
LQNLLIHASFNNDVDVVRKLLTKPNININETDNWGNTALMSACNKGHIDVVNLLLDNRQTDVNLTNHKGFNALISALYNNKLNVVDRLLQIQKIEIKSALLWVLFNNCSIEIITKLLLKSDNTKLNDIENNYVYDCINKRRNEFSTDMFNTVLTFTREI